eukprot:26675_1
MPVDEVGYIASNWDAFSCSYRSWSTNIWLLHIFSMYFPFWLNSRRQLWQRQLQFAFIVMLYILCTGWLVWLLNTSFMHLGLFSTIFLIFGIVLQGLSFIYMGYVFVLRIKQLFGNIDVEDMLIEMQHERCHLSWIKSFMRKPMELKLSQRINIFLCSMLFMWMILLLLWCYSFSMDIQHKQISLPYYSVLILMWIALFIVIGVAFVIPFVVISSILYLRMQDLRYLTSNQQYYNKILDLYALICSKHVNEGSEINVIPNEEISNNSELQHYVDYNKRNDCRGLIKFYEQIHAHFMVFFNEFKYWFLLSGTSTVIYAWNMISQVYGSCIHQWDKCHCLGATAFSLLYMLYGCCIIIIIDSAIQITQNANELEQCIEYTLNKCIVDSYKIGIGLKKESSINEQQWNKEIIVLNRLSVLTLKKPLHFQIFGLKVTKPRAIWFVFGFVTAKLISMSYEFLK